MREILFRGKCKETGKWYKGQYINLHKTTYCFKEDYEADKNNDIHQIVFEHMTDWGLPNQHLRVDVFPETVGQYTGLTDKNGIRIFEGDIIRYTRTNKYAPDCSFHKQDLVSIHLVLWDSSVSAFVQQHYSLNDKRIVGKGSAVLYDDRAKENIVEVIGNIHYNPELLGGADK